MSVVNKWGLSFILLFAVFFGIKAQVNYRQTGSGLKFYFAEDKPGITAKRGQLVSLHLVIKSENGQEIKNSYNQGKPILFPVKVSAFEGDIYEAVGIMSAGDSTLFKISADSMFVRVFKKEMPSTIRKGSDLDITIKTFEIWNQEDRIKQIEDKQPKVITEEEKIRRKKENALIEAYIKKEQLTMNRTDLGVYYAKFREGKGKIAAEKGSYIAINYSGTLLNGKEFESTYTDENGTPVSFSLGNHEVILGWDDVLQGAKSGDYLKVIIPSHLAFGKLSKGEQIPPNATLVFDIEVMSVR